MSTYPSAEAGICRLRRIALVHGSRSGTHHRCLRTEAESGDGRQTAQHHDREEMRPRRRDQTRVGSASTPPPRQYAYHVVRREQFREEQRRERRHHRSPDGDDDRDVRRRVPPDESGESGGGAAAGTATGCTATAANQQQRRGHSLPQQLESRLHAFGISETHEGRDHADGHGQREGGLLLRRNCYAVPVLDGSGRGRTEGPAR